MEKPINYLVVLVIFSETLQCFVLLQKNAHQKEAIHLLAQLELNLDWIYTWHSASSLRSNDIPSYKKTTVECFVGNAFCYRSFVVVYCYSKCEERWSFLRADSLRCRSLLMKMARGYSYTSLSSNSIFFLYFCGLVYNSLFSPMSLLTFRPFFDKDTPHKMLESQRSICLMFQGEK